MDFRIVRQPNGLFARFSDTDRNFTRYNMNAEEAEQYCRNDGLSAHAASAEVLLGAEDRDPDQPGRIGSGLDRWEAALRIIEVAHGDLEARKAAIQGYQ